MILICSKQITGTNSFIRSPSSILYTSLCWAQACSHNGRAWAVVPMRAQCGLESSHISRNLFADVCKSHHDVFLHRILHGLTSNSNETSHINSITAFYKEPYWYLNTSSFIRNAKGLQSKLLLTGYLPIVDLLSRNLQFSDIFVHLPMSIKLITTEIKHSKDIVGIGSVWFINTFECRKWNENCLKNKQQTATIAKMTKINMENEINCLDKSRLHFISCFETNGSGLFTGPTGPTANCDYNILLSILQSQLGSYGTCKVPLKKHIGE